MEIHLKRLIVTGCLIRYCYLHYHKVHASTKNGIIYNKQTIE